MEPWYHVAKNLLEPPVRLWFNWRFEGLDRVPASGPLIVAGNHLSYVDPAAHAYFMVKAGRRPRFLAKRELFDHRLLGPALRGTRQISVDRGSGDPTSLEQAARALRDGEVVVVYPEGTTTTTSADFSPGRGKTGAIRLAFATGVPILPVATWGGQYVWRKEGRQSLAFGRPIWVRAGDLFDAAGRAAGDERAVTARRLTDELMGEIGTLVASLRSGYPQRWPRPRRVDVQG